MPGNSQPGRMRIGCCGSMIAPASDPVGIDIVEELAPLGYDYIELSLRDLVALPAAALDRVHDRLQRSGLRCEACNNFFPPEIPLTGPAADLAAATRHAENALAIATRLGAATVIFGSAGARNVPAGFPLDAAWDQLRALLRALGPIAQHAGIAIAIEHLNRAESNIVNSLAEAGRLAREVAHPHVRVLADAYHLRQENESPAVVAELAPWIAHAHVAERAERVFPSGNDLTLAAFFAQLQAAGYAGRCSVEAYPKDFPTDAARALRVCRDVGIRPA